MGSNHDSSATSQRQYVRVAPALTRLVFSSHSFFLLASSTSSFFSSGLVSLLFSVNSQVLNYFYLFYSSMLLVFTTTTAAGIDGKVISSTLGTGYGSGTRWVINT